MKGFDPNTEKGRKWWINGMGKSSEDELVVEQFAVLIAPSGDYHEYFQDLTECLIPELMLARKKKKKGRKSKGKKKGKKTKGRRSKKRKTRRKGG